MGNSMDTLYRTLPSPGNDSKNNEINQTEPIKARLKNSLRHSHGKQPEYKTLSSYVLRLACLVAIVVTLAAVPSVMAQAGSSRVAGGLTDNQVTEIIRQGREMEREGRWGDALGLYQQKLKADPDQPQLSRRRSIARIHFDLERRYSDASFIDSVQSSDGNSALGVYAEVLLKIQSYYVDNPNWADLASYGLTSLEVAMMSPEFRNANLRGRFFPLSTSSSPPMS